MYAHCLDVGMETGWIRAGSVVWLEPVWIWARIFRSGISYSLLQAVTINRLYPSHTSLSQLLLYMYTHTWRLILTDTDEGIED